MGTDRILFLLIRIQGMYDGFRRFGSRHRIVRLEPKLIRNDSAHESSARYQRLSRYSRDIAENRENLGFRDRIVRTEDRLFIFHLSFDDSEAFRLFDIRNHS